MSNLLRLSVFLILLGRISTLGATTIRVDMDLVATSCATLLEGDCSAQLGATTVDFNDAFDNRSGYYTSGIATYVWDPQLDSPIVRGSRPFLYASPGQLFNPTPYLSVGTPGAPGIITINLSKPIIYFGIFMGSPDQYNSISFFSGDTLIEAFSGDNSRLKAPGATLGSWDEKNYINFYIEGGVADKIIITSTEAALETDNHAFVAAPDVYVPEPSTECTLGIGGILLAAGRLRILRRKKTN